MFFILLNESLREFFIGGLQFGENNEFCNAENEPVFITKNGYGDLVIMSLETFEQMLEVNEMDAAITEAESTHYSTRLLYGDRMYKDWR